MSNGKYFTSKKTRFKGKQMSLHRGSGSIPPEITEILLEQLGAYHRMGPENRAISQQMRNEAIKKQKEEDSGPRILCGSVAREQATRTSDIDLHRPDVFTKLPLAVFAPYEIIGAAEKQSIELHAEINKKREEIVLDMIKNNKQRIVSSADVIIDLVNRNTSLWLRAEAKGEQRKRELTAKEITPGTVEAELIQSITGNVIETINELVKHGKLKRHGFHEYEIVEQPTS